DPLAELPESVLVDRLDAEEHDLQPEPRPELEDLLVSQEDVATRLHVVALLDPASRDGLADCHAVIGLDERDVVEDEEARLSDLRELLDGPLGRLHAVAATEERPRAAEGTVPRAAAAELDGGTRVELADEVLSAVAEEVARRQQVVEVMDEDRRRALPVRCHGAGHPGERAAVVRDGLEQALDGRLALAPQDTVDRPVGLSPDFLARDRPPLASPPH